MNHRIDKSINNFETGTFCSTIIIIHSCGKLSIESWDFDASAPKTKNKTVSVPRAHLWMFVLKQSATAASLCVWQSKRWKFMRRTNVERSRLLSLSTTSSTSAPAPSTAFLAISSLPLSSLRFMAQIVSVSLSATTCTRRIYHIWIFHPIFQVILVQS